jgi:hypothetical protein
LHVCVLFAGRDLPWRLRRPVQIGISTKGGSRKRKIHKKWIYG